MRAVVIDGFDGPEGVRVADDVPVPAPARGQVLVRVEAAGVNPIDAATTGGLFHGEPRFPMVLCWDAAGTVEDVGAGVGEFTPGQPVVVFSHQLRTGRGVAAELVAVDQAAAALRPEAIDAPGGATLPTNGLTAWQALDLLDLKGGERLLVIGATGQVGGFAVQLAAYRGVEVFAPVAPDDAPAVLPLGVGQVVDRGREGPAQVRAMVPEGVDAVLQAGGSPQDGEAAMAALRDGGRYVTTVGPPPDPGRGIGVTRVGVTLDAGQLRELAILMGEGILTPRVASTLPFDRAAEALNRVVERGLRGKLVLVP